MYIWVTLTPEEKECGVSQVFDGITADRLDAQTNMLQINFIIDTKSF